MATCCIPYAICPSVLKLPLATSVPYRNPAAPRKADRIVLGGWKSSLAPLTWDLRVYLLGRMEAFTIRRDDTNALLKFNLELPISESALQIDCNFLEGTASSQPACLPATCEGGCRAAGRAGLTIGLCGPQVPKSPWQRDSKGLSGPGWDPGVGGSR